MLNISYSQGELGMPEYLTKEEVRQWRSSLERITLEEYAARLGKVVQGEKQTNDMIDRVMTHSLNDMSSGYDVPREKLQTLVLGKNITEHKEHTVVVKQTKEKELSAFNESEKSVKLVEKTKQEKVKASKENKEEKVVAEDVKKNNEVQDIISSKTDSAEKNQSDNGGYTFKKPLIPREQLIFNYLLENKGKIVYAKDMAALLELPRDYVYKYIKNLRQKLNEDVLTNASNGGYVLA